MWKLKNYRFGVDLWGLALFVLIMLPNFVWLILPTPKDILRQGTLTPGLDQVMNITQYLMIGALCFLINRSFHPPVEQSSLIGICFLVFLYLFGWIFYYVGFTAWPVIGILSIAPSLAFVLFARSRKNGPGLLLSLLFLFLHTLRSFLNYV